MIKNIVAFTGAFPMNDPQFIITIMIDNPKGKNFPLAIELLVGL